MLGAKQRYTFKEVKKALQEAKGFLTVAAKSLGCISLTILNYIERYPDLKQVIKEEREKMKDYAETTLLSKIQKGDVACLLFFLKCQAKERGYIERQELAGVPGSPLIMIREKEFAEMTPELATQKYLELIKSVEVNVLESNVINKQLRLKESNEDNEANKFKRKKIE